MLSRLQARLWAGFSQARRTKKPAKCSWQAFVAPAGKAEEEKQRSLEEIAT